MKGSHWALCLHNSFEGWKLLSCSCCFSPEGSRSGQTAPVVQTAVPCTEVFLCSTGGVIHASPSLREYDLAVVFAKYNPFICICYLQMLFLVTNLHGQWLFQFCTVMRKAIRLSYQRALLKLNILLSVLNSLYLMAVCSNCS